MDIPLCGGWGAMSVKADRAWERHQLIHSSFHPFHLSERWASILLGVVKVLYVARKQVL